MSLLIKPSQTCTLAKIACSQHTFWVAKLHVSLYATCLDLFAIATAK